MRVGRLLTFIIHLISYEVLGLVPFSYYVLHYVLKNNSEHPTGPRKFWYSLLAYQLWPINTLEYLTLRQAMSGGIFFSWITFIIFSVPAMFYIIAVAPNMVREHQNYPKTKRHTFLVAATLFVIPFVLL